MLDGGAGRVVWSLGLTHGFKAGWAQPPLPRNLPVSFSLYQL